MCLVSILTAADWNIMNQKLKSTKSGLQITLKNYREGWRMNVELNNLNELVTLERKYMSESQFKIDSEATIDECTLYLNTFCDLKNDGKDAWNFDIDGLLLGSGLV
ncbi:HAD superfamily, subfamily IIIB acid phosphatase [Artemisia annua]|uniref:HAD superfamily, subfamily IIIB acid phosphatase n=1 Tax=Artemisia annua TaxID=35608 RepID=A0A2U1L137_ARTAN|nr:HAD superfamily, subfamily IIIB acid phosphatase [Artemisia annua]